MPDFYQPPTLIFKETEKINFSQTKSKDMKHPEPYDYSKMEGRIYELEDLIKAFASPEIRIIFMKEKWNEEVSFFLFAESNDYETMIELKDDEMFLWDGYEHEHYLVVLMDKFIREMKETPEYAEYHKKLAFHETLDNLLPEKLSQTRRQKV